MQFSKRTQLAIVKVNNRNTRTRCEICSNLTVKTPERRQHRSDVFIFNLEHISHLVDNLLLILGTICYLQQLRTPLKTFFNLALVYNDTGPT